MKKVIAVLLTSLIFTFSAPLSSTAATTNLDAIKELKKIKSLAKSGKTLNSGSLKLNSPYEKFYKKFGKPIYTFTPQGAAFEDHFTNGMKIYTSGKLNANTWELKRVKNDKVKSITQPYKITYSHVQKVFGSKKSLSYASGDYFITYKVGKNEIVFNLGDGYYELENLKLYNTTLFSEYTVVNWN